ncbi:MAG: glycosyltransferase N-terminal domain-containing protein [Gammaproteobacteria bacterium]|jgi:3-deoxy-D-manno-octulosonic-acid transferase|nr:glycosyltransferase N-terminal domain-containing protein [Gammaproteobacteria bacterium]
MTRKRAPDWRYRILSPLAAPALAAHALWQARRGGGTRLVRERIGFSPHRHDRPVWIHMSSVGEVNAAQPLIAALRERYPALPLMATTFTPTGAATVQRHFGADVEHRYLPADLSGPTRRFLGGAAPRCAIIMETEIWPRLFDECRRMSIPVIIVNGRLSRRTLGRPAWMRTIIRRALSNVELVLARSASDAAGFAELGVPPERIRVIDNLKFAGGASAAEPIRLARPYVVAASTHEDEEWRIARAWSESALAATHLLVIVPRHPDRREAILRRLRELPVVIAVRSAGDPVDSGTGIHLADTFGELRGFIAGAELVLTGGTLVPRGGQNVIEAARAGKVTIFGPHMENFAEERTLLLEHQAAVEVSDEDGMVRSAAALLADPQGLNEMGLRARAAVESRGDIVGRYLTELEPWLGLK